MQSTEQSQPPSPALASQTALVEFPEVLDSTILSAAGACHRRAYWAYFRHQAPEGENIHLHAGACYARGLETARRAFFDEGATEQDAILTGATALINAWGQTRAPDNSAKSVDRVLSAYEFYFSRFPLATDYIRPYRTKEGKSALEFSFVLPLPFDDLRHPKTGLPLLYAGRFDMLGVREGAFFGVDDKTTSQLGATWGKQWTLRGQFSAYSWGAREHGYPLAGFAVRGVSILKNGHDSQEALISRSDWMIDAWLATTHSKVERLLAAYSSGYWEQNFDHACHQFGPCPYMLLCDSPQPEQFLSSYYKERRWNPAERPL